MKAQSSGSIIWSGAVEKHLGEAAQMGRSSRRGGRCRSRITSIWLLRRYHDNKRRKQITNPRSYRCNKRPWRAQCCIMPMMMLFFSFSQGFFVSIIYCYCNGEVSDGNTAVHQLIAAVLMRHNYLLQTQLSVWILHGYSTAPFSHRCSTFVLQLKETLGVLFIFCFKLLVNKPQSAACSQQIKSLINIPWMSKSSWRR